MAGPWDPARGLRCNPAKLLLDPYAKAISGSVTFEPEVLGQDETDPAKPNMLDSAGHVPRSLVIDTAFSWQRRLPVPGRRYHRDNRTRITPRQPFDRQRTAHSPGPDQRAAQLRHNKLERQLARMLRGAEMFC